MDVLFVCSFTFSYFKVFLFIITAAEFYTNGILTSEHNRTKSSFSSVGQLLQVNCMLYWISI